MSELPSLVSRIARLTASQVHTMLEAGILRDGEPFELIDGLLLYKDRAATDRDPMTIGERHNLVIKLLARLDPELAAFGMHMQTQGPLRLSERSEPEPDGAIVRGDPRDYSRRIPETADVTCVLEVADSSLEYDRTTKLDLYATAAIPQYVIINVREHRIEVHSLPEGARYTETHIVHPEGMVELFVGDGSTLSIPADRLLP